MRHLPVGTARRSARQPWRAIVAWLLFVALCLVPVSHSATTPRPPRTSGSARRGGPRPIATDGGLQRRPTEHVLIRAGSGPLDGAPAGAAARDVRARMAKLPEVAEVGEPVRSADGTALRIRVVPAPQAYGSLALMAALGAAKVLVRRRGRPGPDRVRVPGAAGRLPRRAVLDARRLRGPLPGGPPAVRGLRERCVHLRSMLAAVGIALTGRSGARLARIFGVSVSRSHVNRIKMLKRQMFGRAAFRLLRKRVLLYS